MPGSGSGDGDRGVLGPHDGAAVGRASGHFETDGVGRRRLRIGDSERRICPRALCAVAEPDVAGMETPAIEHPERGSGNGAAFRAALRDTDRGVPVAVGIDVGAVDGQRRLREDGNVAGDVHADAAAGFDVYRLRHPALALDHHFTLGNVEARVLPSFRRGRRTVGGEFDERPTCDPVIGRGRQRAVAGLQDGAFGGGRFNRELSGSAFDERPLFNGQIPESDVAVGLDDQSVGA